MIQVQTKLKTMDNSGARKVQCIKALNGFNRTYAFCGDFIIISIKELRLIRKVKVGEIHLGLVARAKKESKFKSDTRTRVHDEIRTGFDRICELCQRKVFSRSIDSDR